MLPGSLPHRPGACPPWTRRMSLRLAQQWAAVPWLGGCLLRRGALRSVLGAGRVCLGTCRQAWVAALTLSCVPVWPWTPGYGLHVGEVGWHLVQW